jgi:hypothetical protein
MVGRFAERREGWTSRAIADNMCDTEGTGATPELFPSVARVPAEPPWFDFEANWRVLRPREVPPEKSLRLRTENFHLRSIEEREEHLGR